MLNAIKQEKVEVKTLDDIQEPLNELIEEIKGALGAKLSKIILYGSYARGEQTEDSDIDLMILTTLEDSEEIRQIEYKLFESAFEIEFESMLNFSIIVKNENHFNYWIPTLPFYSNINNEGVLLSA